MSVFEERIGVKRSTRRAPVACVESVSVLFRSKKRGARVKDRAKNGASKRGGHFQRGLKPEKPVPRPFFAPNQYGNACYAG